MSGYQSSDLTILAPETIVIPWYLNLEPIKSFYIRKKASKILLGRDSEMIENAWARTNIDIDLTAKVSKIIADWCEWPNALFAPNDRCSILFQDISCDLTTVEVMRQIEEEIVPNLHQNVWDKLDSISYGELMKFIQTDLVK